MGRSITRPWRPVDPVNPPDLGKNWAVFAWGMVNDYGQMFRSCSREERDKTMNEWNHAFLKEWQAKSPEAKAAFREEKKRRLQRLRADRIEKVKLEIIREKRWMDRLKSAIRARGKKFASREDLRRWSFDQEPSMPPHGLPETYEAWLVNEQGKITDIRFLCEDKSSSCIGAIVRLQFSPPATWGKCIHRMDVNGLSRYCELVAESMNDVEKYRPVSPEAVS